jgi:transcriptional regulator with PAS, ATPase and Fis domain
MTKQQEQQLAARLIAIQELVDQGDEAMALQFEQKILKDHPELIGELVSYVTEVRLKEFLTVDEDMLKMKDVVRKLSRRTVNDPVLILGESGTGKELIARALHGNREGNFVAINCTSLPDYLLESELFGHERGAFTGAVNDKPGLFHYANNGTIFMDEIGDMPLVLQAKLLRVLQDGMIRPVGANKEIKVNVRVVCATNQDINDEKKFRLDLRMRINTFVLKLKSLRERPKDIKLICYKLDPNFIYTGGDQQAIPSDVLKGNVRELQAMVRRYQVLGEI